jgi:hypothetical protein
MLKCFQMFRFLGGHVADAFGFWMIFQHRQLACINAHRAIFTSVVYAQERG